MVEGNPQNALRAPLVALIVVCAVWIGYVAVWGQRASLSAARPTIPAAALEEIRLAPDFAGPGAELAETTARPLFNPSRRLLAGSGGSRSGTLQSGRYELTGVSITPTERVAMLLDVGAKKTVRIVQGKELNGVIVEAVAPSKVTLRLGAEIEELPLKIAVPKQAAAVPANPDRPGHTGQASAPAAPPVFAAPPIATPPSAALPGAPRAATDIANADPITEADVAEREARTRARRNRQAASDENQPR